MKYDAFISYRRENGFLMAQVIRDRLKDRGISCFLDLEEDKSGKFDDNLLSAIDDAPNFILILPKNALNRCVNADDWVRREVLAAIQGGKTIIPVMYDGFHWPKKWHPDIPEELRQLQYHQGVSMSKEYLSAMIDKIISYMTGLPAQPLRTSSAAQRRTVAQETAEFFAEETKDSDNIVFVDMAFHSGSAWRRDTVMVDILSDLVQKGVSLRVIINSAAAAELVCSHMRQPLKKYAGFDQCIAEWMEIAAAYPQAVQVRIADVPLLHRTYLVRKKDGSGGVNVKYYTYGNFKPNNDFRRSFDAQDPEYRIYAEEFDYLWEAAGKKEA